MNDEMEAIRYALKGDEDAVSLCGELFAVTQVWDDLIDGDSDVTHEEVNKAFYACLVEIPGNAFFQAHIKTLQPILASFIIDWLDANRLERQDDHGQNVAFVLRDSIGGFAIQCARIIGGLDWALEVSIPLRRLFINNETLADYKNKLSGRS